MVLAIAPTTMQIIEYFGFPSARIKLLMPFVTMRNGIPINVILAYCFVKGMTMGSVFLAAGCGAGSKTETIAAPTTEAAEQAGQTAPQAAEGTGGGGDQTETRDGYQPPEDTVSFSMSMRSLAYRYFDQVPDIANDKWKLELEKKNKFKAGYYNCSAERLCGENESDICLRRDSRRGSGKLLHRCGSGQCSGGGSLYAFGGFNAVPTIWLENEKGEVGIFQRNVINFTQMQARFEQAVPDGEFIMIPGPAGEDGGHGVAKVSSYMRVFMINRNVKNPERILQFFDYMGTQKAVDLTNIFFPIRKTGIRS